MAIHQNVPSMLQESLLEMLLVAKHCIEFQKDTNIWQTPGCYGYPAALILVSIADSIGSYVEQGTVENHFQILVNADYYGSDLNDNEIKIINDYYRNTLVHHSVLAVNVELAIGSLNDRVLQYRNEKYRLNLVPFYNITAKAVNIFLNNPQALVNNKTIENIERKL